MIGELFARALQTPEDDRALGGRDLPPRKSESRDSDVGAVATRSDVATDVLKCRASVWKSCMQISLRSAFLLLKWW